MRLARATLLVLAAALAAACESSPNAGSREPAEGEPARRISPLGLGQSDPDRLFDRALTAFENRDVDTFLSCFAFIGQDNRYFVPSRASAEGPPPNLDRLRPLADGMRQFLRSDFASVTYARPVNVRNDPPTVAVEMTVHYDFSGLSEARKDEILAGFNETMARQGATRPMTWQELTDQMRNGPRTATRRFVYVDGAWRFDAGWGIR